MAAVDMSRVNIRGAVNRRALQRYAEFWTALYAVGEALERAERFAAELGDSHPFRGAGGRLDWSVSSPEEMRAAAKKAHDSLRVIGTAAKKWEADLISREWRS